MLEKEARPEKKVMHDKKQAILEEKEKEEKVGVKLVVRELVIKSEH